jgi:hypothetical protein
MIRFRKLMVSIRTRAIALVTIVGATPLTGCGGADACVPTPGVWSDERGDEVLLRRVVGRSANFACGPVLDCQLRASQLPGLGSAVRYLIGEAAKGRVRTADHIVATLPSIEYLAYRGNVEFVLREESSQKVYLAAPDGEDEGSGGRHPAAVALERILDAYCPRLE